MKLFAEVVVKSANKNETNAFSLSPKPAPGHQQVIEVCVPPSPLRPFLELFHFTARTPLAATLLQAA